LLRIPTKSTFLFCLPCPIPNQFSLLGLFIFVLLLWLVVAVVVELLEAERSVDGQKSTHSVVFFLFFFSFLVVKVVLFPFVRTDDI